MKKYGFISSLYINRKVRIIFIAGLISIISGVVTVMALDNSQKSIISAELARYRNFISTHPDMFQTQERIDQFYGIIRKRLKSKIDILQSNIDSLNGIMAGLPNAQNNITPPLLQSTTCTGLAPTGNGVIRSTNLTSFGGGGIPTWEFVTNTKGTNTDLGISCVWTCAPGYKKNASSNGCVLGSNNPKTIWTDNSIAIEKYEYNYGEKIYGYIDGGDPTNTWACLAPPTLPNSCDSPSAFRKLAVTTSDEWQINQVTGRIELRNGLHITSGLPSGIYVGYTRIGQDGVNISKTTFLVK